MARCLGKAVHEGHLELATILAKIMTGSAAELSDHSVRREVVSFVRRSNRMRPNQRRAWEAYHDRFVLNVPRLETSTSIHPAAAVDLVEVFGRDAELIVEIGPGAGESLIPMAEALPHCNVLAFEVYRPAIARMLGYLVRQGLDNVRIVEADAVAGMPARFQPLCSFHSCGVGFAKAGSGKNLARVHVPRRRRPARRRLGIGNR